MIWKIFNFKPYFWIKLTYNKCFRLTSKGGEHNLNHPKVEKAPINETMRSAVTEETYDRKDSSNDEGIDGRVQRHGSGDKAARLLHRPHHDRDQENQAPDLDGREEAALTLRSLHRRAVAAQCAAIVANALYKE